MTLRDANQVTMPRIQDNKMPGYLALLLGRTTRKHLTHTFVLNCPIKMWLMYSVNSIYLWIIILYTQREKRWVRDALYTVLVQYTLNSDYNFNTTNPKRSYAVWSHFLCGVRYYGWEKLFINMEYDFTFPSMVLFDCRISSEEILDSILSPPLLEPVNNQPEDIIRGFPLTPTE